MKSTCVVLLTFVWLASWTGIMLGLAGCLTPPEIAPVSAGAPAASAEGMAASWQCLAGSVFDRKAAASL